MIAKLKAWLGLEGKDFKAGISSARGQVNGFEKQLNGLKSTIARAFAAGAVINFTRQLMSNADEIDNLAKATNMSASSLQTYKVLLEEAGFGVEKLSATTSRLRYAQAQAVGGNKDLVNAFERLGVSTAKLEGLAPDELLSRLADGFVDGAGASKSTDALFRVLGKSAGELTGVLQVLGTEGLDQLKAKFTDIGLVIDDQYITVLDKAEETTTRLWNRIKGGASTAVASVVTGVQALKSLADPLQSYGEALDEAWGMKGGASGSGGGGGSAAPAVDAAAIARQDARRKADEIALTKLKETVGLRREEEKLAAMTNDEKLKYLKQQDVDLYQKYLGADNLKEQLTLELQIRDIREQSAKIEADIATTKEKEMQAQERARTERIRTMDKARELWGEYRDIRSGAGVSVNREAASSYTAIGATVGGNVNPMLGAVQRQIQIQENMARFLEKVAEHTRQIPELRNAIRQVGLLG